MPTSEQFYRGILRDLGYDPRHVRRSAAPGDVDGDVDGDVGVEEPAIQFLSA